MTYVLPKVGGRTLRDRVAVMLEEQILEGAWGPGDRLPTEFELSDQLGVSRAVVRDSLRSLAARGLVEIRQGVGTTVANSDAAYVDAITLRLVRAGTTIGEVAEARAVIECMAVGVAANRRTDADVAEMLRHLTDYAQAVRERRWPAAMAAHLRWHLSILEAAHMPALTILLLPMQRLILESARPPKIDEPRDYEVDAEQPIFAAIEAKDPEAAERAMRQHFRFMSDKRYRTRFRRPFSELGAAADLAESAGDGNQDA
jgi:DNA-binding FadR family transcriptional regulator